jgi:hypothetical protein
MLLAASLAILGLAFALPQLLRLGQRAVRFERERPIPSTIRSDFRIRAARPRSVASIPPNAKS